MTLPSSIFRYRSLTTFSIAELATSTMWISSVESFNDPFEFQFDIEPLVESKENREFIISSIVSETGMPRNDVELEFEKYSWDDFRDSFVTPQENLLKEIRSQGVCCFSANKDNLLMWGHYCDGHSGFVVEYDTTKFPFQHVVPVEYDDQLCVFTIQEMIYKMSDCLEKLLVRKSTDWSYEDEYRLIHSRGNNNLSVSHDPEAIKAIYFGNKCSRQNVEIICNLTHRLRPRYFSCELDSKSYKINFQEMQYTPPEPKPED
jgi:hypothetical protein